MSDKPKNERHPNVTNIADVPTGGLTHGQRFGSRQKRLGAATGGKRLGCSYYEVDPGKTAFPYHAHFGTEEAMYVLEGEATLRLGGKEIPVRAGDYVAFPTGADSAHQLVNSSAATVRYLCLSAALETDVTIYPDSGKLAVLSVDQGNVRLREIFKRGTPVDYWDGED
jgi:uncharacterized cupin superfamily protein